MQSRRRVDAAMNCSQDLYRATSLSTLKYTFCLLDQELYLRNNELEHLPPDVFSNMARLSQLALSGNRLKLLDGNMFAHMPGKTPNVPIGPFSRGDQIEMELITGIFPLRAEETASL